MFIFDGDPIKLTQNPYLFSSRKCECEGAWQWRCAVYYRFSVIFAKFYIIIQVYLSYLQVFSFA